MRRTRSGFALLALALGACGGQVPGSGPRCSGPPEVCEAILAALPRIARAAEAEGFPDVSAVIDYEAIAGMWFETTGVLDDAPLCGLNTEHLALYGGAGLRCLTRIAAEPGICGLDLLEVQVHEYGHCTRWWGLEGADGKHADCGFWGPQPLPHLAGWSCLGAPPGTVQRIAAAARTSPP